MIKIIEIIISIIVLLMIFIVSVAILDAATYRDELEEEWREQDDKNTPTN